MRAPHPAGARIVKLDARLARLDIGAHEWGDPLVFIAPPTGALPNDARAARLDLALPNAAARPWAPAHLRARRLASGDVRITWVRRARAGGDFWGAGDPPLGAPSESYRLDILDGADVVRSVDVAAPAYDYSAADQTADFGGAPASLRIRVAQAGASGAPGLSMDLTLPL